MSWRLELVSPACPHCGQPYRGASARMPDHLGREFREFMGGDGWDDYEGKTAPEIADALNALLEGKQGDVSTYEHGAFIREFINVCRTAPAAAVLSIK